MGIAYLVNQYPKVSHSFIRREIAALEKAGIPVSRFSIRHARESLVDPADQSEYGRTEVLLEAGIADLFLSLARALVRGPRPFFRALWFACQMGAQSFELMAKHLAYFLEACLLRERLDVCGATHLHVHFATNATAVALLCQELGGPSFSFTVHGPDDFERAPSLSLGLKISKARNVFSVSQYGHSQLLPYCPTQEISKLAFTPMGVDDSFLDYPWEPIPPAPRLVFIGRLDDQKAPHLLLDAAVQLRRVGVCFHLELWGDGPLRAEIAARIAKEELADNVFLCGAATGSQVRDAICAARALVLPSKAENLPVVIMEAFALGRPVIASKVGGVDELVEPGVSGWLIPAGDATALAQAMQQALTLEPEQLEAMGQSGSLVVRSRHNHQLAVETLTCCFAKAIKP